MKLTFEKFFIHLKKTFLTVIKKISIVYFILKHIVKVFLSHLWDLWNNKFEDKSFSVEMKSLLFSCIIAFFFYYFIVIELSILIFGYSLLCYWFLFIFIFVSVIISWRLEVFFLKQILDEGHTSFTTPMHWYWYYDGKTPYTFYNFITNYKSKRLFWRVVIDPNIDEIEEAWLFNLIFFILFISIFFYLCSYWFWPKLVNFVSTFFYPIINFFEVWNEPRLTDWYASLIWFWSRLMLSLEWWYKDQPTKLALLKKIPSVPTRWEDWSNRVWLNKISLWKTSDYGDIFFLRELRVHYPVYKLVFNTDQPTVLAGRFDTNEQLFFLWYFWRQFDSTWTSFWKKYFKDDPWIWKYLLKLWDEHNQRIKETEVLEPLHYFDNDYVISSYHDIILSQNYFDQKFDLSIKSAYDYGTHREIYDNLVYPKHKKYVVDFPLLEWSFTWPMDVPEPQSYFGLRRHHKKTKDLYEEYQIKTEKEKEWIIMYKIFKKWGLSFKALWNILFWSDFDIALHNYDSSPQFKEVATLLPEMLRLSSEDQLVEYLKKLDWRLATLEEKYGLEPLLFEYNDYVSITWKHLINLLVRWLRWLDVYVNNRNIFFLLKNWLPNYQEFIDNFNNSFRPSRWMWRIYEKFQKSWIKIYISPSKEIIQDLMLLEKITRDFEKKTNLWTPFNHYLLNDWEDETFENWTNKFLLWNTTSLPWYVWSIKYFNSLEPKVPLPGFVWFYTPTPYPTPFSTFGLTWFWFNIFWLKNESLFVSESISFAGDRSSTPNVMYTGVEAIMYFRPILNVFDYISTKIIWLVSYPIEFFATSVPIISEKLPLIIFLVHITWFIHFYIYLFLFLYVFYYFAKYYYYKSTYMWIYEWMFETAFINQNNGFVYWHTLTDMWKSYKDPNQFAILSLQTSLLLSYGFGNLINFIITTKYGFIKFLHYLSLFFSESKNIINYFYYYNDTTSTFKNLLNLQNFRYFRYFFNINYKKYNMLLYDGGSDCNTDFLVWDYFDYLCQTSIFISKSLLKNIYFYSLNKWFITLIKHSTILFSSFSLLPNFQFLSMPVLDNSLSRKLFEELIYILEMENFKYEDSNFFLNSYLFNQNDFKSVLDQKLFLNLWFNFFNFFTKTGLDFYKLFDLKELNFISKFNKKNIWDSEKYWLFAFFWSFRFIPKTWYPYINISWTHEYNWLQLRWMAYSNSWIGSTINVRPYFNMIQHIWWTSRIYTWAFSLTDTYLNLNKFGINTFDNVWNFSEKWYSDIHKNKVETMFGLVWTLKATLGSKFDQSKLNYNLTYSPLSIEKVTTNWLYDKVNPPLDLLELDITPYRLFFFFKDFPKLYMFTYLTFFEQLEYIDKKTYELIKFDLKNEYLYKNIEHSKKSFLNKNPKQLSTLDFYLKKFDSLLNVNDKNLFCNWMFSFDVSYFFNHFLAWDYMFDNQEYLKTNNFNYEITKSKLFNFFKNQSFSEINAKYSSNEHWFDKPFGVLDRYELIGMQRYKSGKSLDNLSFTSNKENTFNFLEKETLWKISGLSSLDFEDTWTVKDAYNEKDFLSERSTWSNINNSLIINTPGPIILGWVGELYNATIDSTSILFTTIYAADEFHPLAFWEKRETYLIPTTVNYKGEYFMQSYFNDSMLKKQLYSWLFTWLNLMLFSTSYWNFFGIKSLSWLDYWSWKCGIQLDYWHGFYNYWPYLGFRHTFGTKLMVFDSMYGFYRSYRQIEDDPTILDLNTDAMEQLYEDGDDVLFSQQRKVDYREHFDLNNREDWQTLRDLSQTYREIYFSFHHPFFLGYFLFWFFLFLTKEQYLGIANFSFKWLILYNFIKINNLNINLDFNYILNYWNDFENKFRKNMFRYRLYFVNPIKLTHNFTNLIDKETSLPSLKEDHILTNFFDMYEILLFFKKSIKFNFMDLSLLLDTKLIDLQLIKINWYNMDIPFQLTPYIIKNELMFNSSELNYEKIYNSYFLSFSHFDSLWENVNFNLLFDDYMGSYLDSFNFISYYSTFWSLSTLPDHFLDRPNALASKNIVLKFDKSKQTALNLLSNIDSYDNQDLITSHGLIFQNFSFINFFTSTLQFILLYSNNTGEYKFFLNFLEFYFKKTDFGIEFMKFWNKWVSEEDKQYSAILYPVSSFFAQYKHTFFLMQLCWNLPYDSLTVWLDLGVIFFSTKTFKDIYRLRKISITNRFFFLKWFYNWIGYQLYIYFFWK